ncbi:MAG: hypothetical protein ACREMX_02140 [Gemmatimonadales bacterium]
MRRGQAYAGLGLLLGLIIQACDRGSPVVPDEGMPYRSVEIDLGSLQRPSGEGVQQGCVSVVAEAVLRVTAEGGTPQVFRKDVPVGGATVRFDSVEVQQGAVEFSAQIVSNNGTVLYSKEVSQQIDGATFSVPIQVDKQSPVLQVCPGDIALGGPNRFAILQVRNRGTGTLMYQAISPACDGGPCLGFEVPDGSVAAGDSTPLFTFLQRMAPQASLELRIESPEGSVPIDVTLGQVPELVPVSLDSTGPHQFSQDTVVVPVRVVIRNDGNVAAAIFKVAAEYTDQTGNTFVTPFRVSIQADQFYLFTEGPLEPAGELTLEGIVMFRGVSGGQRVQLRVEVDSCSGDELFPAFCRVDEFDEFNNRSEEIPVFIPSF